MLWVFDLDGTLADTKENIVFITNKTLCDIGFDPLGCEIIVSFVGDGSRRLLKKCLEYYKCSDDKIYEKALTILFEYYYEYIEEYTYLYHTVEETLAILPGTKVVLTNKPGKMAKRLLPSLKIDHYFQEIIGGDVPEYLKPNPHYLNYFMQKYPAKDTYMIGDSVVDIQVAKNAGATSIAVTYGFNPKEDLLLADIIIDEFCELTKLVAQ